MKNLYSLFLLTILSTTLFAQTTRRVNGDSDITGVNVYNTIQAAVDAANTDDIILIEPYGKNQGLNPGYDETVTVDKKLHFRGNGYNLDNPLSTLEPLDNRPVTINGSVTFDIGSDASTVNNLFISGSIAIFSPNVKFESSKLTNETRLYSTENSTVIITEGTSPIFRKCILRWVVDGRGNLSQTNSNLNMILENCIVYGYVISTDNSIFKNCQIQQLSSVDNSVFTNCIFYTQFVGVNGANYNNAISFCLSFSNDLPTLGNNINNAAWQQVFKGPSSSTDSYVGENDSVLSNSSIAKNAGLNGGDIGIYGGTYPYELSGLPHHPISTFFINSGIGNNSIDIDAVITIKAN